MLRIIWSVVEQTETRKIENLSDTEAIEHLLGKISQKNRLSIEEIANVRNYLHSRVQLIRDLMWSRSSLA